MKKEKSLFAKIVALASRSREGEIDGYQYRLAMTVTAEKIWRDKPERTRYICLDMEGLETFYGHLNVGQIRSLFGLREVGDMICWEGKAERKGKSGKPLRVKIVYCGFCRLAGLKRLIYYVELDSSGERT